MRLIDADALRDEVNRLSPHPLCEWDTMGVLAAVERMPTIDAVPVVRCKDCEFAIPSEYSERALRCTNWQMECNKNGFCNYGETK